MGQKADSATSLESSLERIQSIVTEMESGNLPLDTLIARFEEGVGLVKTCQQKLDAAEKRIEIIVKNARGEASLEAFREEE